MRTLSPAAATVSMNETTAPTMWDAAVGTTQPQAPDATHGDTPTLQNPRVVQSWLRGPHANSGDDSRTKGGRWLP